MHSEASNIEPFTIRAAVIDCVVKSPRSTWPKLAAGKIVARRRTTSDARGAQVGVYLGVSRQAIEAEML